MKPVPVVRAALGGLSGRRVQAIVIGLVVGISTAVSTLALGLVVDSNAPFDHAFSAQHGADVTATVSGAATTSEVNKDVSVITAALPHGSVLGTQSWLDAKAQATSSSAPWVPFIVAFGLIGLAMSVLIVVNVVSGAVVAGIKRIGVLKSVGFSPPQVVAAYVLQVAVPALIGCVTGVAAGNLLAMPMLGQTAQVYGVGRLAVPLWVSLAVPLVMVGLVVGTASAIALRAGRMSAVQAIATGRAPRPRHGYGAHRLLGRAPVSRLLPRPVSIGLAGPFARPTRTLVTLAAIVSGVTAVIFGFGLGTSLDRVQADLSRTASEQVQVFLAGQGPVMINGQTSARLPLAEQESAVQAALHAQPGTQHYAAEADGQLSVLGLSG
jgi:putative ABC transport system permease protein